MAHRTTTRTVESETCNGYTTCSGYFCNLGAHIASQGTQHEGTRCGYACHRCVHNGCTGEVYHIYECTGNGYVYYWVTRNMCTREMYPHWRSTGGGTFATGAFSTRALWRLALASATSIMMTGKTAQRLRGGAVHREGGSNI